MTTTAPTPIEQWSRQQRTVWWPADVLRLVAFVSVPLAWWAAGPASGLCLLLVAGGVMLVRLLALPVLADCVAQVVLLVVAWAAVLGAYQSVTWLDVPAHVAGTAVATLVVWRGLELAGAAHLPPAVTLVLLLAVAALLSVLWEVGEWLGHRYVSDEIGVGYDDTVLDLVWGTLGGLVVAVLPRRSA